MKLTCTKCGLPLRSIHARALPEFELTGNSYHVNCLPRKSDSEVKMQIILNVVSSLYGYSIEEILTGGRQREFVVPRQIIQKLGIDNYVGCSFQSLYVYSKFGKKKGWHHATVLHGNATMSQLIEIYPEFRDRFEEAKEVYQIMYESYRNKITAKK